MPLTITITSLLSVIFHYLNSPQSPLSPLQPNFYTCFPPREINFPKIIIIPPFVHQISTPRPELRKSRQEPCVDGCVLLPGVDNGDVREVLLACQQFTPAPRSSDVSRNVGRFADAGMGCHPENVANCIEFALPSAESALNLEPFQGTSCTEAGQLLPALSHGDVGRRIRQLGKNCCG